LSSVAKAALFCSNALAKNLLLAKHFPIIDRESFDSGVDVPKAKAFDSSIFFSTFSA
jgi:hypothetical protein